MVWDPPSSIEAFGATAADWEERVVAGSDLPLLIRVSATGAFMGMVTLQNLDTEAPRIGVWLREGAQGKGYGREAGQAVLTWLARTLAKETVHYPVVAGFLILHLANHGNSGPMAFSAYAGFMLLARFFFGGLPDHMPRVVSVGRLDINTEGLLLLTNDGGLARALELPETGWLRRYRVRAYGSITQDKLDALRTGIEIDGVQYGPIEANLERVQGSNVWLTFAMREGKNREIRNVLRALGRSDGKPVAHRGDRRRRIVAGT